MRRPHPINIITLISNLFIMEAKKRIYIVSFGDSDRYRVEFEDVANVDPYHHTNPLKGVESEITKYLNKLFPGEALAYYDTPKIEEVYWKDREKYADIPLLDEAAVKKIETGLKVEVENRNFQDMLDSNAPYANIN